MGSMKALFSHKKAHIRASTKPTTNLKQDSEADMKTNPKKKLNVVENTSSATFICEVCKRKFPNATALAAHATKHSTIRKENSRLSSDIQEKEKETNMIFKKRKRED